MLLKINKNQKLENLSASEGGLFWITKYFHLTDILATGFLLCGMVLGQKLAWHVIGIY